MKAVSVALLLLLALLVSVHSRYLTLHYSRSPVLGAGVSKRLDVRKQVGTSKMTHDFWCLTPGCPTSGTTQGFGFPEGTYCSALVKNQASSLPLGTYHRF